ncbi:MAG: hypothetical protein BAA02_01625 [Paenibacillaceae bacterium ZCTH02-B3]|nr:MAG: hypothetical protein BAA02_01625 [Paenibacillaceae bacterium ZCTH02-B3]
MFRRRRAKQRGRKRLAALLAVLVLAAGTGCQGGMPDTALPGPGDSPEPEPPAYVFGIIYPYAHPLYEWVTRQAEETAREHRVKLMVRAPDEAHLEQQIRMMETLIKEGVDGIAIAPVDSDALVPIINRAVESGIPVVCFESDAPDSKRMAFIGTDNLESGRVLADRLAEMLGEGGMVIVESGMSRMESLRDRLEGFLTRIYETSDVRVLDVRYHEGDDQKALADLEIMTENHPHFNALIALDPVSVSSAVLFWKAKGLKQYLLAFGLTREVWEAVNNGQITHVVSQGEFQWGKRIVHSLLALQRGRQATVLQDTGTELYSRDSRIDWMFEN